MGGWGGSCPSGCATLGVSTQLTLTSRGPIWATVASTDRTQMANALSHGAKQPSTYKGQALHHNTASRQELQTWRRGVKILNSTGNAPKAVC